MSRKLYVPIKESFFLNAVQVFVIKGGRRGGEIGRSVNWASWGKVRESGMSAVYSFFTRLNIGPTRSGMLK